MVQGKMNLYLQDVSGVIHVGAHTGQERRHYAHYDVDVVWVEPIPAVFKELCENIQSYPKQKAYRYLITDKDNDRHTFNVTSNDGASSSIYKMGKDFLENHPTIYFTETIPMYSMTLPTMLNLEGIDARKYDALVLDTQGAELLVLKGAEQLLHLFEFIRAEATDYDLYKGCCQLQELEDFLHAHGFEEECRRTKGHEFDIVYRRAF